LGTGYFHRPEMFAGFSGPHAQRHAERRAGAVGAASR
jgi:hypothetical protein